MDAHGFDHFPAAEVRECHGNVEVMQCAEGEKCNPQLWRVPLHHRFTVNKSTMLCNAGLNDTSEEGATAEEATAAENVEEVSIEQTASKPAVGRVQGRQRRHTLRYMPAAAEPNDDAFPADDFPRCPKCGSAARPAILHFGDYKWIDSEDQETRHHLWIAAVEVEARRRTKAENALKVVLLEIGAGNRVPTVRYNTHMTARRFQLCV